VLIKTALTNQSKLAHVPLGTYTFKGNGRAIELPVTAFDVTPVFQTVIDCRRVWQPLERVQTKRRTRALRTIPPTDPDWRRLFGGREDTESMHNHIKEKWFGHRVRAVGLELREFQLRGYQIHQGITALLAWHYRTGGGLSRYFGEWEPPNRGSVSRT